MNAVPPWHPYHAGHASHLAKILVQVLGADGPARRDGRPGAHGTACRRARPGAGSGGRHGGGGQPPCGPCRSPACEAWPRLWWCPVGPLAFLPLHAAGRYDGTNRLVMDRVISSYAATLRSLGYARSRRADSTNDIARSAAVIVTVPAAPGVPPLPAARSEARAISAMFLAPGSSTTRLQRMS